MASQDEYEFPEFVGIDIDPEDRSVGLFGNSFDFIFKKDEKIISIMLDDEQLSKMIKAMEEKGLAKAYSEEEMQKKRRSLGIPET